MKRIVLLFAFLLLSSVLWGALAETELISIRCEEENFSTKAPAGKTAEYVKNTGLQIYSEHAGYVPYVIISRRPLGMKLKNPTNYLNNVYREYMENQYKDDMIGTNPCRKWDVGGKTLLGARYMYKVQNTTLCLLRLIEVRDDGDVEYSAKYIDGQDSSTMAVLDATVRYYQPGDESEGSAKVKPVDVAGTLVDKANGTYLAKIKDADRIMDGGYFTAELYIQDIYPGDQIETLKQGDQIVVNGQPFTVASMEPVENGLELYPQEEFDGYIVFQKASNTAYTALVNDWTPCTQVGEAKIMMPLPYRFSFRWVSGAEEETVYDADGFVSLLMDGSADSLSQFNTTIQFEDNLVITITHTDYPLGPEEM